MTLADCKICTFVFQTLDFLFFLIMWLRWNQNNGVVIRGHFSQSEVLKRGKINIYIIKTVEQYKVMR